MPTKFDAEASARARVVRAEQEARYRKDYQDDDYWRELARNLGTRMPPYYSRPADQEIKFWLKLAKVSYAQFLEAYGWKDAEEFEKMNPTHGMKVLAGLILELGEENKRLKKIAGERCDDILVNVGSSLPPPHRTYRGKSKTTRRLEERLAEQMD